MKTLLLTLLLGLPSIAIAGPFVVTDPTTQIVTHCGYVLDVDAKVDSPVAVVTGGSMCKIDVSMVAAGSHTIKATFVNIDPVWGRSESVFSVPLTFVRPASTLPNAPTNLMINP